jgi:hypothetical protein
LLAAEKAANAGFTHILCCVILPVAGLRTMDLLNETGGTTGGEVVVVVAPTAPAPAVGTEEEGAREVVGEGVEERRSAPVTTADGEEEEDDAVACGLGLRTRDMFFPGTARA